MRLIRFLDNEDKKIKYCASENGDNYLSQGDIFSNYEVTSKEVNMVESGIIDPVLVTKSALKNAVSVALTIMSADCVISNIRIPNASN